VRDFSFDRNVGRRDLHHRHLHFGVSLSLRLHVIANYIDILLGIVTFRILLIIWL
jgi:hypothetical protein